MACISFESVQIMQGIVPRVHVSHSFQRSIRDTLSPVLLRHSKLRVTHAKSAMSPCPTTRPSVKRHIPDRMKDIDPPRPHLH